MRGHGIGLAKFSFLALAGGGGGGGEGGEVPCLDHGSSGPERCDPIMGMAGMCLCKTDLVELAVQPVCTSSCPPYRHVCTSMYIPSCAELQLGERSFSGSLGGCEH